MKRRSFISLATLAGLGLALGGHRVSNPSCSAITSSLDSPLLRFAAVGDVGTGNKKQYQVAQAMGCYHSLNPFSLVLLAGDNIYENGNIAEINTAFETPYRFFRKQNIPFYAVLGNHDVITDNGKEQVRYQAYNMRGRYYTFTKGIVQFFALDTNTNNDNFWSQQLAWLEDNLARSQAKWKIVFGHHPVYSSGKHGNTDQLVKTLPPLFTRYGVRLYLNGHDHNYERTVPLDQTTYLTCGAGAKLRPIRPSEITAYCTSQLSFASIEVFPEYVQLVGLDINGQIFDRATINWS